MSTQPSPERIKNLKQEIQMSLKFNEEELKPMALEAIKRYTGEYVPTFGNDWDIVLNEIYPVIQDNLPSTFFRTPRAFLKPRNKTYITKKRDPGTGKMVDTQVDSAKSAKTQENILNYTLSEIKYKKYTQKVLLDALLFPHGVMWHGYKGDFGMTEESSIFIKNEKVFVDRISPMRLIKDPAVSFEDIDKGRWVGRVIDMRLEDLMEDDDLDVDKKQIKGFEGFGAKAGIKNNVRDVKPKDITDIHKKSLIEFADEDFRKGSASKFVRLYEIYLRPTKKEKKAGSKGWILLLADEQEKPLRSNDWSVKAEGFPARLLMFNPVPDRMTGMADISTYASIADQKNVITNLQIRNAQESTKVWVGINKDEADEEAVEKVEKGQNTILLFSGETPASQRMFVASPGGQASNELYLIDQRIQKNLEDKSGVSDLKRGFLQSGEESAASVKIRAAGSNSQTLYRQDIMKDFVQESLHYINQLNKQFVPVKEAVRIVGSLDLEWSDNPTKEELQADTDVEIDAISMLPENPEEELRRYNELFMLALQGVSNPDVMQKLREEGSTFNLTPLIEQILLRQRIKNPEIFRKIRPEESEGFVSVQQIRQAKENVNAALQGTGVPYPPRPEDDHLAKLEIYTNVKTLLDQAGQVSDILEQLLQAHMVLLQEIQEKQSRPGQKVKLNTKRPQFF